MTTEQQELIDYLQTQYVFTKYLYKYHWQVGSRTFAPICVWEHEVTCFMTTDKKLFAKLLERVKHRFDLDYARFWKSDGSCPSELKFGFKNRLYWRTTWNIITDTIS